MVLEILQYNMWWFMIWMKFKLVGVWQSIFRGSLSPDTQRRSGLNRPFLLVQTISANKDFGICGSCSNIKRTELFLCPQNEAFYHASDWIFFKTDEILHHLYFLKAVLHQIVPLRSCIVLCLRALMCLCSHTIQPLVHKAKICVYAGVQSKHIDI